jgi:hypothetical protein
VGGSLEPRGGAQRLGRRRALAEGGAHRGGGNGGAAEVRARVGRNGVLLL